MPGSGSNWFSSPQSARCSLPRKGDCPGLCGGKRPGAGRKPNPPRRYCISLPNALGRELDARAKAAGMTSYRWIVNALKRALEAG